MRSKKSATVSDRPRVADDGFSVCIAAFNEAKRIGRLLHQLIATSSSEIGEILVCANGCEDETEAVVERYRRRDPRVILIISEKGKPAAWNALMQAAHNDLRLFLDADVELAVGFLRAMSAAVRAHPTAAIVAARDLPRMPVAGLGARLAAMASRPFGFDYVSGRAYVLRRSAIADIAHPSAAQSERVPIAIPLTVLAEDLWLEVYVGRERVAFARDAYVSYEPGDVGDVLRTRARLRVARRQIAELLPEAFTRWFEDTGGASSLNSRVWHRLSTTENIEDAAKCAIGVAARSMLLLLNRTSVSRMEAQMLRQMYREGGQAVLSGSGRLNK